MINTYIGGTNNLSDFNYSIVGNKILNKFVTKYPYEFIDMFDDKLYSVSEMYIGVYTDSIYTSIDNFIHVLRNVRV
jgi:hypothetical protein